jgi:uncharacterized membrane protein
VSGLYLERNGGELVKTLSAPLLATLIALIMTNIGIIPSSSEVYTLINRFMLPLAVPMLLLSANLRKVFTETKRLLGAFLLGSLATCIATCVTFYFIPLANLGAQESWKVASALASRHIGGAVNFIAVAQTLEVGGDAVAAALAADNLICALYFMTIFFITRNIGPEPAQNNSNATSQAKEGENTTNLSEMENQQGERFENASSDEQKISVYDAALSLGFSSIVCLVSSHVASNVLNKGGLLIPIATFITVALATLAPKRLEKISPAGEGLSSIIMQFFFAAVGASGSIQKVLALAPLLFLFSFLQVYIHLILILGVGKVFKYSTKELVLASNANVGGPTTAAAMCVAKQWRSFFVPSMLSGILGYAIATFISIAMGQWVLKPMAM